MLEKIDLVVGKIRSTAKILSYVAKVFSHVASSFSSIPRFGDFEKKDQGGHDIL